MINPRILFVLPVSGGGGGANSVVQESIGLRRLGVPASIALKNDNLAKFSLSYPELHAAQVPVLCYNSADQLAELAKDCDVICATTNASVQDVKNALDHVKGRNKPRAAYYVQDYEPLFYAPHSPEWKIAHESYTLIPDCTLFAKTEWLCNIVYDNHGVRVAKVEPSIDHDIYYPDLSRQADTITITAMLRPQTPRRAPIRTARIMEAILTRHGGGTILQVFGAADLILREFAIRLPQGVVNHGSLRRTEVPSLLRNSDLFLDLSDFQAFGRTGLEAMASGCAPIVPILGGSNEYIRNLQNGFAVDTRSDAAVLAAVDFFLSIPAEARGTMKIKGIATAKHYSIVSAALSELELFKSIMVSAAKN